jgi:hypothetical protein
MTCKVISIRKCGACGGKINKCMGSVNYQDFVLAMDGKIPFNKVRELCGGCILKKIYERVISRGEQISKWRRVLTP